MSESSPESQSERESVEPCGPIRAVVRPPGSKSLTNRALTCAAMARGNSRLIGALDSEDTRVMCESLARLGIQVVADWSASTIDVTGCGGELPVERAELHVANSGTSIRFLTALVAAGRGEFRLDGVPRMRQRPIGDLLAALRQLGAEGDAESPGECPPVLVRASGLRGGEARVRGDISSQFLSGLLMASPYARRDVVIEVDGELVSKPYVRMTLEVMRSFGVDLPDADLEGPDGRRFVIPAPQAYAGRRYEIEPDASAASYFWGAAAITGGEATVAGLTPSALQGDVAFCDCLRRMGCEVTDSATGEPGLTVRGGPLRGIDVDMNAISDTAQTLAAVALFAEGPTTIRGVAHIRHKETDRIGDLARELRRLGAEVDEFEDGLRVTPRPLHGAEIETYNDHRMAMSLALVGLRIPGVVILNPRCTEKTYPRFFDDLRRACARP